MKVQEIAINEINIIENIRLKDKVFDKEKNFLMQSIKDNGLLQPIGVKEEKVGYTLMWGFRRLDACKKLGFKTIPAVIFAGKDEELTEEEFFVINATENLQRRNNSLLEFGRVCKILRKTMGTGEIAVKLGVPKSRVNAALTEISRIPIPYQKKIQIMDGRKERDGDIPLTIASSIANLRGINKAQKVQLLDLVSKDEMESVKLKGIASLMKKGMGIREAKETLKQYKTIHIKVLVKADKLKELTGEDSDLNFFIHALNKEAKDDRFAIKFTEKDQKTN